MKDPDNIYSYSTNNANVEVPEDAKATWTLDSRCDYKGRLTGSGTLTVNVTSVRCNMQGDWSQFEGTLNFVKQKTGSYDPLIQWNNDYGLGKATVMGEFDNSGKNVTIGTLSDKVTLTGSGRYTVNHLDLTISKSKAGLLYSYIEVAGTMMLSGDITVTVKGTLKARDEVVLWKCGSLLTSSNLVVNLPELPEGLYWDTTDFLKKEGKLRVTDTPTGISDAVRLNDKGQMTNDNWYSLDGRKLNGEPKVKGIYIYKGKKVKK